MIILPSGIKQLFVTDHRNIDPINISLDENGEIRDIPFANHDSSKFIPVSWKNIRYSELPNEFEITDVECRIGWFFPNFDEKILLVKRDNRPYVNHADVERWWSEVPKVERGIIYPTNRLKCTLCMKRIGSGWKASWSTTLSGMSIVHFIKTYTSTYTDR